MSSGSEAIPRSDLRIGLRLPRAAYTLSAVHKAGYRLARSCTVSVEAVTPEAIHVALLLPTAATDDVGQKLAAEFYRHLTDEQLREKIREETQGIRELILAHAFSRTDLVRRD